MLLSEEKELQLQYAQHITIESLGFEGKEEDANQDFVISQATDRLMLKALAEKSKTGSLFNIFPGLKERLIEVGIASSKQQKILENIATGEDQDSQKTRKVLFAVLLKAGKNASDLVVLTFTSFRLDSLAKVVDIAYMDPKHFLRNAGGSAESPDCDDRTMEFQQHIKEVFINEEALTSLKRVSECSLLDYLSSTPHHEIFKALSWLPLERLKQLFTETRYGVVPEKEIDFDVTKIVNLLNDSSKKDSLFQDIDKACPGLERMLTEAGVESDALSEALLPQSPSQGLPRTGDSIAGPAKIKQAQEVLFQWLRNGVSPFEIRDYVKSVYKLRDSEEAEHDREDLTSFLEEETPPAELPDNFKIDDIVTKPDSEASMKICAAFKALSKYSSTHYELFRRRKDFPNFYRNQTLLEHVEPCNKSNLDELFTLPAGDSSEQKKMIYDQFLRVVLCAKGVSLDALLPEDLVTMSQCFREFPKDRIDGVTDLEISRYLKAFGQQKFDQQKIEQEFPGLKAMLLGVRGDNAPNKLKIYLENISSDSDGELPTEFNTFTQYLAEPPRGVEALSTDTDNLLSRAGGRLLPARLHRDKDLALLNEIQVLHQEGSLFNIFPNLRRDLLTAGIALPRQEQILKCIATTGGTDSTKTREVLLNVLRADKLSREEQLKLDVQGSETKTTYDKDQSECFIRTTESTACMERTLSDGTRIKVKLGDVKFEDKFGPRVAPGAPEYKKSTDNPNRILDAYFENLKRKAGRKNNRELLAKISEVSKQPNCSEREEEESASRGETYELNFKGKTQINVYLKREEKEWQAEEAKNCDDGGFSLQAIATESGFPLSKVQAAHDRLKKAPVKGGGPPFYFKSGRVMYTPEGCQLLLEIIKEQAQAAEGLSGAHANAVAAEQAGAKAAAKSVVQQGPTLFGTHASSSKSSLLTESNPPPPSVYTPRVK